MWPFKPRKERPYVSPFEGYAAMPEQPPAKCGNCEFWRPWAACNGIMACKVLPPVPVISTVREVGPTIFQYDYKYMFSPTNEDDWCGKHEYKQSSVEEVIT